MGQLFPLCRMQCPNREPAVPPEAGRVVECIKLSDTDPTIRRLRRGGQAAYEPAPKPGCGRDGSILVLDDGVRAVSAAGGFRVPLALVILVFDGFRVAGDLLLLGGRLRGCERLGMGWEGFRKHGVNLIGPAAVVLDDLVGDIRHVTPFRVCRRPDSITFKNSRRYELLRGRVRLWLTNFDRAADPERSFERRRPKSN